MEALVEDVTFSTLPEETRARLLLLAQRRTLKADAFLFHQGDEATYAYFVERGHVKLTQVTLEGHEIVLGVVGPGGMVGGIVTLLGMDYPVSARAIEDTTLLYWHRDVLYREVEQDGRLGLFVLRMLAARFQDLQNRYRELASERVERRIARTLLRLAVQAGRREENKVVIPFPVTRQMLADMSGTTLYTVSRVLKRWQERGLIESERQRISILSPHALVRVAEDLER